MHQSLEGRLALLCVGLIALAIAVAGCFFTLFNSVKLAALLALLRRLNADQSGLGFGDGGVCVTQAFDYYKYSTTDGKRLWSVSLGSHGAGHTPAYNNKRLLVPGFTSENIVRILDSGTGAILGTFPADGEIGMQVHVGPPMKVEYRNIRIKSF